MDLHRTSIQNQMDYDRDPKEGKPPQSTDERLDSGLDSLKEEDYQAVADELVRLRVDCERPQHGQTPAAAATAPPLHEWTTETTTEDGDTLLHLSIINKSFFGAKCMIDNFKKTPFLSRQNNLYQTALHLAVIMEQADVCQKLLASGCDPTLVDFRGDTPLHIAIHLGNLACFSVLTQHCPLPNLVTILGTYNYEGQNCLHVASVHGFLSMVEDLLKLGADINAKEQRNGRSALHLAVDQQNTALVQLLLSKGADPNLLTSGGYCPYHLTYGRVNEEIRRALFALTDPDLIDLPDSESDDSDEEEAEESDEEMGYDDIQWNGH